MCVLKALQSCDFLWCFVYNILFKRIMLKEGSRLLMVSAYLTLRWV